MPYDTHDVDSRPRAAGSRQKAVSEATAELVPGRSCDGCAMCCMLFDIPALEKKAGVWCSHCEGNQRCAAYEVRPQECRDFFCHYRLEAAVPEHWKPSLSHMVVRSDASGVAIQAHVDPAHPDAWRAEPYYSDLKAWARNRLAGDRQVHVRTGGRTIVILPDRDVDLGNVSNRVIVVQKTWAVTGFTVDVSVVDLPPG
jgi:hypothetical protein